jgi:hypothetical protein
MQVNLRGARYSTGMAAAKQAFKPTRKELLETIHNLVAALEDASAEHHLLEEAREMLSREASAKLTAEVIASGMNASGDTLQLAVLRGWEVERFAVGVERGKNFLELDAPAMGLQFDLRFPVRGFTNLEELGKACGALLADGDQALKFVTPAKKGR